MGFSTILSNILIAASGPFAGLTGSEAIVSFLLLIDAKIYGLFADLYSLYTQLARAQIFDVSAFDFFVNNVYVIFGVVSLFILAFFLLQGMINPDEAEAGTKSMKQFVTRFVTALFLTFLVPTMFDFLYDVQDSLISYSVIPKLVLSESSNSTETTLPVKYQDEEDNPIYVITEKDENGNIKYKECDPENTSVAGCEELVYNATVDLADINFKSGGYRIGYHVLNGFFYPNYNQDIIVDASEHFTTETGIKAGVITCIVAGGATLVGAVITGVSVPATGGTLTGAAGYFTAHAGAFALAACGVGGAAAVGINALGEKVTAKEYSWEYASTLIQNTGDFEQITYFAEAVVDGRMAYTPLISTIAGIILLYLVFSFCLDLGVRAAKLTFYQVMAPISFLISTIPSKKDLMGNWFKAVITTWLEVFIRIFCVCGVALLIRELNLEAFSFFSDTSMGLIAKAIIVLGLVTFAKQFPTILGDLTGIKSGNLKLGIKEKLATGGAFTAGAIIGGGATAFARNLTNKWGNKENWKNKDGKVTAGSILKNIGGGLASASAGAASGQFRAGKAGLNAKSFADMKGAAGTGAAQAVDARDKRAAYKAKHGGKFVGIETDASGKPRLTGTAWGHISDLGYDVASWAGYNNISDLLAENQLISEVQSQRKAIDNEARELILGDVQKMKGRSDYDTASHNMKRMEELNAQLAAAKSGSLSRITDSTGRLITDSHEIILEAERQYNSYLKQWQDELVDMSMLGETSWGSVSEKTRSELAKVRMAGDKYRETLARNVTAPFIAALSETARTELLDKNVDLTVSHEALDSIKDKMKIEQTQISKKINEVRQKEEERKKDK